MAIDYASHLSSDVLALFWRYPSDESEEVQKKLLDPKKGPYLFFRRAKTPIQARFAELIDHDTIPHIFIHGSAHIDNYAKTQAGFGIVDYDRAQNGPYAWDLACILLALSFRCPSSIENGLEESISHELYQAYLRGFHHPEASYQPYAPLETIKLKKWEMSTQAYLKSGKKWAKQLKKNKLHLDDPIAQRVLQGYLESRHETNLLDTYTLKNIARCAGSFGRPRFLFELQPLNKKEDAILIDLKQTRHYGYKGWAHEHWYSHNFAHEGERMIAASQLYSPDCTVREGYATVNGIEYWGRQIPTLNRKPPKIMTTDEQFDFAASAGSQIGRGHRLALENQDPKIIEQHVKQNFSRFVGVIHQIQKEMLAYRTIYLRTFYPKLKIK